MSSEKIKVLGIDGWTEGVHHYSRVFKNYNNFKLIHLGKYGDDKGRPHSEVIKKINIYDIDYYKGKNIFQIIKLEKPDFIVFLSLDAFTHRAINIYSKYLNIKTIHLFHGVQSVYNYSDEKPFGKSNFIKRAIFRSKHFIKGIRYFWPMYLKSLIITKAPIILYIEFIKNIFSRILGKMDIKASITSKADYAFVLIESDRKYAISRYGYKTYEVECIGYPDLNELINNDFSEKVSLKTFEPKRNIVTYIETSLYNYGYCFERIEQFLDHLKYLNKFLKENNYELRVKFHPSSIDKKITDFVLNENIVQVSKKNLYNTVIHSKIVLVEPSTLALLPTYLEKKIGLVKWGKLKSIAKYGDILESYPKSFSIHEYNQIIKYSNSSNFKSKDSCLEWKKLNIGPTNLSQEKIVLKFLNEWNEKHNS